MLVVIQPLDHRILVKRFEFPPKFSVTLTDAGESRLALVLAAGPGKQLKNGGRRPMGVKVGDVVFLPGIASDEPDWQAGRELMITEDDVGLIVEGQSDIRQGQPHEY